jgi:hypothetical protein
MGPWIYEPGADVEIGTFEDPIIVNSGGEELQCGCTGSPADSHEVRWCVVSRDRPYERCDECGSGMPSADTDSEIPLTLSSVHDAIHWPSGRCSPR